MNAVLLVLISTTITLTQHFLTPPFFKGKQKKNDVFVVVFFFRRDLVNLKAKGIKSTYDPAVVFVFLEERKIEGMKIKGKTPTK